MGTDFTIHLYAENRNDARILLEGAFGEIDRVEQLLSSYRPSSELSRINRLAGTTRVKLDPEMFALLDRVLSWSTLTHGAFDPTVGPLMDLWGFTENRAAIPSEQEITDALSGVGVDKIEMSREKRTVRYLMQRVRLDAGGFGKGYALDQAADVLRESGVVRALLEAGRSTYLALDAPPDRDGWPIVIPDPDDDENTLGYVALRNSALSTSGRRNRFVVIEGRRFGHIIDPRSGRPVTSSVLTSVMASGSLESDILSTAVYVLGPRDGANLIRSLSDASAMIVSNQNGERFITRVGWKHN